MTKVSNAEKWWQGFGFNNLDAEEFKKRTSAVNAAIFTVLAGLIHSFIYVALGFPYVTIAVISYATCSITNLIYLRVSHNFNKFRNIQLILISFSPFFTQLFIGGFINGSAVAMAGFIAPATALLYTSNKRARAHYYLFAALMVVAAIWDVYIAERRIVLPVYIISAFFAINLIATLGIIYFLMESFLKKQEELRRELRQSLEHLKATQKQLIQSEKMASLGQLTAGIAHEIQNPLNFVNNFSELNAELAAELEDEISNGNIEAIKLIIQSIKENEQKIVYHGRRADDIVKGMLQHSTTSTGKQELTDINMLCDECLRLSYHGFRAKDKSFSAVIKMDLDKTLNKINIVPQDISRVIINLCNNAFYAAGKKKELAAGYIPTVFLGTKKEKEYISICVKDNGTGIPQSMIDKIFQPFFTTKSPGEGTGLGLSLSYDIIKAHGGELKVESEEGVGSEFIVQIPLN